MRASIEFEVRGASLDEMRTKALEVIAKFLGTDNLDEAENKIDMELSSEISEDHGSSDPSSTVYTGQVFAKVRA